VKINLKAIFSDANFYVKYF